MEENIKVTIIIPAYNVEFYLRECLDSAVRQTITPKEIICIDDGSTDNTLKILQEYAERYSFIHCLFQDNQGAGPARNSGLRLARGEFVTFLDADDFYLEPEALEIMYHACKKHSVSVCGSFRRILTEGKYQEFELHRDVCRPGTEGVRIAFSDYQDDLHYQNYIFERKLLSRHRIVFPPYRRYQDPPFFLQAMAAAGQFWVCPVELYCLRLGHQNFRKYEKMADQTLMGVRDNMRFAWEHQYALLQKRLVERIEGEYFERIVRNLNMEMVELLIDIYRHASEAGQDMRIFRKIRGCFASHVLYERLVWIKQKRGTLAGCLLKGGISRIGIYGLGTFGGVLYRELAGTEVEILYGIDRNKKEFHGLPVISPKERFPDCDAVLITPLGGQGIAQELKKKTGLPLLVLEDFVLDAAEQIRKEEEKNV